MGPFFQCYIIDKKVIKKDNMIVIFRSFMGLIYERVIQVKQIEKLYYEYRQDVYQYLLSLTHNPTLSEDLLSETFLKAIYSIQRFQGKSSIKTWLFGIARYLWLQSLRREKNTIEYSDLLDLYIGDDTGDRILYGETAQRIAELLKTKEARTQQIVNMRIEGISYHEISQCLGITENSARVIDFRTKKWLKESLKEEGLL